MQIVPALRAPPRACHQHPAQRGAAVTVHRRSVHAVSNSHPRLTPIPCHPSVPGPRPGHGTCGRQSLWAVTVSQTRLVPMPSTVSRAFSISRPGSSHNRQGRPHVSLGVFPSMPLCLSGS